MAPSPVITLNRAVALSHGGSLEDALALLMTVEPDLGAYQPLFAAKADILRRLGRGDAAREAYQQALELTTNAAERGFLERQVSGVDHVLSVARAET